MVWVLGRLLHALSIASVTQQPMMSIIIRAIKKDMPK